MKRVSSYYKFKLIITYCICESDMQGHLEKYPDCAFQIGKYMNKISSVIKKFENWFFDFKKIRRLVEYMSFLLKSDVCIKETVVNISEFYSLSKFLKMRYSSLKINIFLKIIWRRIILKVSAYRKVSQLVKIQLNCKLIKHGLHF